MSINNFTILFAGLGSKDEVRLVDYLFKSNGYNPLIRPVNNLTEKVNVKFGLAMIQLINVVSTISLNISFLYNLLICVLVLNCFAEH